jgi:steroid delta-isomerase-like uncharacterized protein
MPDSEAVEVVIRYFAQDDPRYLAEDVEFDVVPDAAPVSGRADVAAYLHEFRHRLFTEVEHDVDHVLAGEREVLVEFTFRGRHSAPLAGITASGRRVAVRMAGVYQVRGGEIQHARIYYDLAGLLRQLQLEPTSVG